MQTPEERKSDQPSRNPTGSDFPELLAGGLAAGFGPPTRSDPASAPSVVQRLTEGSGVRPKISLREERTDAPSPLLRPLSKADPKLPPDLGKYQLQGELARGGVGVVFKGHDTDLGRDVAFKVLRDKHRNNPDLLQRFVEEAQIGGQLQHPGIVPVYDLGMGDGRPFFTMKLIKGRTLAALLDERVSPTDGRRRFLTIFEQVCQTMAYAHARGVIHRDLKPANVMVGAFGEVQVVDWGMGKVLASGGIADEQRASQSQSAVSVIETVRSQPGHVGTASIVGSVMGTPAYMPPEQANGDVTHMDERSDVFALGAILCEILTGQPPYVGEADQLLPMAAKAELNPCHQRLAACGADHEITDLVHDCLLPAPAARPRTAELVAERLGRYLAAVEERARRAQVEAAEERVRTAEARRSQRLTLALAASVLLTVLLGGGAYWWAEQARQDRIAQAGAGIEEARREATLAHGRAQQAAVGDMSAWDAVLTAVQRAESLLAASEVDPALRAQVQEEARTLRREHAQALARAEVVRRDRQLLDRLAQIPLPPSERYRTVSLWSKEDCARRDAAYREAFAAYGIDVLQPDEEHAKQAAQRLAGSREPALIAAGLDDWATTIEILHGTEHEAFGHLMQIALDIDNKDKVSSRLRRLRLEGKLDAAQLRAEFHKHDASRLPPMAVVAMARLLDRAKAKNLAASLLVSATAHHPRHLVLALRTGYACMRKKPANNKEAARHFAVAVALRPDYEQGRAQLGLALLRLRRYAEAEQHCRHAVSVNPENVWVLNNLAFALTHLGKLDEAKRRCRRVLELKPEDHYAQVALGVVFSKQGNHDEAMRCYRRALALTSYTAAGRTNLGNALLAEGKLDEALLCHRRAIALDSELAVAHRGLARVLRRQGELSEAERSCRRALAINPRYILGHLFLSRLQVDQGKLDDAIRSVRLAIALDPGDARPHSALGGVLERQGKTDEAIQSHRRATEIEPDVAGWQVNLGLALVKQGKLDEAIHCCRRALNLDPKMAWAYSTIGQALTEQGKLDAAIRSCRQALKLDTRNAASHNCLGRALHKQGKLDEAIESYRCAIEIHSRYAGAHLNLGVALSDQGKLNEAIQSYRRARDIDPWNVWTHMKLGAALAEKGEIEEAIRSYRRAVAIQPKSAVTHHTIGILLVKQGKLDEAIQCYRRAITLDSKSYIPHYNLGQTLARQGRLDEAIACYRRAIQIDATYAMAHYNLGLALTMQGKLNEAIESYQHALNIDSKYAPTHFNLAIALSRRGRLKEAVEHYRRGLAIDATKTFHHHYNLGIMLLGQDKLDQAAECFKNAIGCDPKDARAYINLGVTLSRQGKHASAIRWFGLAIEVEPTNATAHFNLGYSLRSLTKLEEARESFRQARSLFDKQDTSYAKEWSSKAARELTKVETRIKRLDQVLSSREKTNSGQVSIQAAYLAHFRKDRGLAVEWFKKAFAADQALARYPNRYNAACAAALCSVGTSRDAAKFDADARALLRKQAVTWLREELAAANAVSKSKPEVVAKRLRHWLQDPDLVSLRDAKALDALPASERQACQELWQAVRAELEKL